MILCDTNIFINAFNSREETIEQLQKIGTSNIILPSVVVMELYQGTGNKAELAQMKRKIRFYDVIHIDEAISKNAISLMEKFYLSHGLKIPDAIIGATAVTHGIELYTYNIKDFSFIPNIRLYKIQ